MINRLILSERAKWIFVIGVVALGAGLTVNNVISYQTECMSEVVLQDFVTPEGTTGDLPIF